MKILILDNYDSFTFNLQHLVEKVSNYTVDVKRNNEIELAEFDTYNKIILSPGPGLPEEAGIMLDFIRVYSEKKKYSWCLPRTSGHSASFRSIAAES